MSYGDFVAQKRRIVHPDGITVNDVNAKLFPFQAAVVRWALRRARAAVWADCGLGKSWMAIEWAHHVSEATGKPVIILCPLAVADQFVAESERMGRKVSHADESTAGEAAFRAERERMEVSHR
ncbi:MAG: hypothetical protein KC729_00215 [Candidatus Eisenbacteria bacterium]|uniref:Uncharacterized protein n=1 Tax=Eiseniibacteriota bacterium TaxID=2212470 RepID=A0A956RNQ7_UNCEI|nr:hypothetical protein [Candidatus Eisenbacteria bacterium]